MNFFEQQDQAHRQSKKLLWLFFLAVIAIVMAVDAAVAGIWLMGFGGRFFTIWDCPPQYFLISTTVVLLFIGSGTLYEMYRLRDGGDAVAKMAGGRLILPSSSNLLERRLLNVVEEMALASGIACPHIYVLDGEDAINAFAAGYQQNQSVVAVTRGALQRLTRDELQGVIGHEFSHILNGDMRMNVKLISVLFGIQMLATFGQELLYGIARWNDSRGRDEKGAGVQLVLLFLGAVLFVVGYVGIFFGRLIKSAVSRQREFLADASAVQFTRNPDGIGGALRKIGGLGSVNQCGSRIDNPRAEQLSHMFLGAARPQLMAGLFATHPPLQERLRHVYGKDVAFMEASVIAEPARTTTGMDVLWHGGAVISGFNAASTGHTSGTAVSTERKVATPVNIAADIGVFSTAIVQAARDPAAACDLVCALLLDRSQSAPFVLQLQILQQTAGVQVERAQQLLLEIERMPRSLRLPVLDLAMPALRLLPALQKTQLLAAVNRLILVDHHMTQAEFILQTVLEKRLGPKAGRSVAVRYSNLQELRMQITLLFSLLAQSQPDENAALAAFRNAALTVPELNLQDKDLRTSASLDFFEVRRALGKLNQFSPLAKSFLLRGMVAAASEPADGKLSDGQIDLLRSICAALDVPVQEHVAAAQTNLIASDNND